MDASDRNLFVADRRRTSTEICSPCQDQDGFKVKTIVILVSDTSSFFLADDKPFQVTIDKDLSFLHRGHQLELSDAVWAQFSAKYPDATFFKETDERGKVCTRWSVVFEAGYNMNTDHYILAIGKAIPK